MAIFGSSFLGKGEIPVSSGVLGGPELISTAGAAESPTLVGMAVEMSGDIPTLEEIDNSLSTASLRSTGEVVPDGSLTAETPHLATADVSSETKKLPSRYFIQPASGLNWGILHDRNAVDIANTCGTPISAAAEGTVTEAESGGDWNSGYGNYVMIEHSNGIKTRYAHMEKVSVSVGDFVGQGKSIGTIGNTGNVKGVTGCHLHFEVYGAKNPFAKK